MLLSGYVQPVTGECTHEVSQQQQALAAAAHSMPHCSKHDTMPRCTATHGKQQPAVAVSYSLASSGSSKWCDSTCDLELADATQVAAAGAVAATPAAAAGAGGGGSPPARHRRAPARAAGPATPILPQPSTGELSHQTTNTLVSAFWDHLLRLCSNPSRLPSRWHVPARFVHLHGKCAPCSRQSVRPLLSGPRGGAGWRVAVGAGRRRHDAAVVRHPQRPVRAAHGHVGAGRPTPRLRRASTAAGMMYYQTPQTATRRPAFSVATHKQAGGHTLQAVRRCRWGRMTL